MFCFGWVPEWINSELSFKRIKILLCALFMFGLALLVDIAFADDAIDDVNIIVPVSCTMSGIGMNSHNAEINNGQYNSSIGETTMHAFCNDNEGFAIYAIGYTDNIDGKNTLSNSTFGSTFDIVAGTLTSGTDSQWAMKLSTIASPAPLYPISIQNSFDAFSIVPDEFTIVAKRTSATDIGVDAEGSAIKTTYQAYISSSQPAGTYTGQVKYVLVHPNAFSVGSYAINYYSNGGSGTMNSETVHNLEDKTLATNSFTNATSFSYWCLSDSVPSDAYTCSGTTYEDEAVILANTINANSILNLYAIWAEPKTIANSRYLQEVESCPSTLPTNQVYTLKDSRDEQNYTVTKLSDGVCWMTKNLNIAGGTLLTEEDSNVTSDYTLPLSDTSHFGDSGSGDHLYNSNQTVCASDSPCYSYYTFGAARNACPKGWDLPSYAQFQALFGIYSSGESLNSPPFSGVYAGTFRTPSLNGGGVRVTYWTSTNGRGGYYYWTYTDDSATFDDYYGKFGFSARCVVKQ